MIYLHGMVLPSIGELRELLYFYPDTGMEDHITPMWCGSYWNHFIEKLEEVEASEPMYRECCMQVVHTPYSDAENLDLI